VYFQFEKYAGVVPIPPLLVAYTPKITPAEEAECQQAYPLDENYSGLSEKQAYSPVNPQLTGAFDAYNRVCISDLASAGPAENE